jgi:phosphohistidine phosphatase
MLTLALLRHAKSSWDTPGVDDFSRPLAPRGIAAAPLMGKELKRLSIVPRIILCSAAVRTRETLRLALPDAETQGATVLLEEGLYMASAEMLLARLRRLAGDASPILLIGHNPSLQNLALALAGSGPRDDLSDLAAHFPTAALAVLTFDLPAWSNLSVRSGKLVHFTSPRRLSSD